jgi:hypothetical protein
MPSITPDTTRPLQWTKSARRPLRSRGKSLAIWVFARVVGVAVPWSAVRQADGAALLAYEHERLLALATAGERVPPVLAFDGQALVTGDVGPTLDDSLRGLAPDEQLRLLEAASADLAAFHARGQWHGGAQSRNMTWDGERFARLDFEEKLCPALPLRTVQAYDMLQLVFSLARPLAELGPLAVHAVLRAYAEGGSPVDLRAFLRPLLPRLCWVSRLAAWSSRLNDSREVKRLRTVLDGMQAFVAESSPC